MAYRSDDIDKLFMDVFELMIRNYGYKIKENIVDQALLVNILDAVRNDPESCICSRKL